MGFEQERPVRPRQNIRQLREHAGQDQNARWKNPQDVVRKLGCDNITVGSATAEAHSLFLTISGEVYACGAIEFGKLGFGKFGSLL